MSVVAIVATFLAASVEWVEALTIILAVGLTRGWRSALTGAAAALIALLALVAVLAVLGAGIGRYIPIELARTLVGVFLLLFGIRWLHKAILRSSGLKAMHDEDAAFAETREQLGAGARGARALDWAGVATAFNGTFLEGLEVVFIVIALAALNGLATASVGAVAALVAVAGAGAVIRGPLSRVPENTMKYVVGIMLTSFGTFFAGEGLGVAWWNADVSLIPLIAGYALCSLAIVQLLKRPVSVSGGRAVGAIRGAAAEIWGLFVGEGPLAIATLAVLFAVGLFVARVAGQAELGGLLLGVGVVVALLIGLSDGFRQSRKRVAAKAEPAAPERATGARDEAPAEVTSA